jgi:hypothetical protein
VNKCVWIGCALLGVAAQSAHAQTMLDQEIRLVEIHSLLLALPQDNAPGAFRPGHVSLELELIGIPTINGQTGGKVQFTASDRTPLFPRPRLFIGLPAPDGFRAYAGLAYIPPITVFQVTEHFGAIEAGLAWAPESPLTVGARAQIMVSRSETPVTDPTTRDVLENFEFGGDLSAGYRLRLGVLDLTPFAAVGLSRINGVFRVITDNETLTSRTTNASVTGGVRLATRPGFEAFAEVVAFPGRLVHPAFGVAWTFDLLAKR